MKVTFFSNYLTHHQIPVSNELYEVLGNDYTFVSCESMENERKQQGWNLTSSYPYELKTYLSEENKMKAINLALSSDVVIIGAAPREYLISRLRENKLTIRYSERYFKEGRWKIINPRNFRNKLLYDFRYRNKEYLHMLCAGEYAADDFRFIHSYPGRMYKWGYFPKNSNKGIDELITIKSKFKKINIIWVSRFIDWKHPIEAIKVCEILVEKGYNFQMNMIGTGPLKEESEKYVEEKGLSRHIVFKGTCSNDEVQKYMEESHVLLHTADRNEGWGAVINEAMSNACAIVSNKMIGAASYLIENGKNGLVTNGTIEDYVRCIEEYILKADFRENTVKSAYITINTIWSPENATKNLIELMENLLKEKKNNIIEGPCSMA